MNKIILSKKLAIIFIIYFIFSINIVNSQESQWTSGTGVCEFGLFTTKMQARNTALEEARLSAIYKIAGVHIKEEIIDIMAQSKVNLKNEKVLNLFSSFSRSTSYGIIVDERKPYIFDDLIKENGVDKYKIVLEVKVKIPKEKPDPKFLLKLRTNSADYFEGDKIEIFAKANEVCNLHLFLIQSGFPDFVVQVLIPNNFNDGKLKKPYREYKFPEKGWFEAKIFSGASISPEIIYGVAIKEGYDLESNLSFNKKNSSTNLIEFSVVELSKQLSRIPLNQRTDASVPITIIKKE